MSIYLHTTLKVSVLFQKTLYIWTTPSVTAARNSSANACICLRMHTVPNSEAEFPKTFQNFHRMLKVMYISPLFHKFAYKPWMAVEGQGRFA